MARRCTTVPGFGVCCRAAQQNILNQPFKMTDSRGVVRCAECSTRLSKSKRHPNKTVFEFRFHKNTECGIGPNGCPYIAGAPGGAPPGNILQLQ